MKRNNIEIRSYTRQFYKHNILCLLIALCGTLLITIAALLVSWLLQQLLDLIGGYDTGITLSELIMMTLALIGIIVMAKFFCYHSIPKFITRGSTQYKEYIFQELTKKNISAFSKENTATYISALTNDIQTIEQGYLQNIFPLISSLTTFCGAIALMLWNSPQLTLASVGLALLPLLASILTGTRMAQAEKRISDENEIYTSTLADCLGGFSVIKSFQAEAQMLRLFKEHLKKLAAAQCHRQKMQILIQAFASVAGIIAQLGIFIFGAYLAVSGKGITAGTTLIFVQLMNYILEPIQTIPTCIANWKAAKALVEKIAALLRSNIREDSALEHATLKQSIRINNLTFGYEPEKQVLQKVNVTFEHGKKYAIVGASGSGKSTLLSLLTASHPNYEGAIFFDDKELKNIRSESLHNLISVVQQNVFIFNASIRDNITMFTDFPREEIDRAIALSGLSNLIQARGEGYLCGENGSGLSGGEKQRIAIARSLLKQSQVLLVDEATSALDTATAYQVANSILALNHMTCIVVTHSLEAALLKQYDQVIVLKNGSVTEAGTFDELMGQKGYFYSLFTVAQ